jgi:hypothetical protein
MMQISQLHQRLTSKNDALDGALNLIAKELQSLLPSHGHLYIDPFILELKKNNPNPSYIQSFILELEKNDPNPSMENLNEAKLVDTYRDILSEVVRLSSKKSIITAIENLLSKIKDGVFLTGGIECNEAYRPLIEKIIQYKQAQIQSIAEIIGFAYAAHLNENLRKIARNHPNAQLELIVLKRHEVSSNATKGFGLFKDADLDATREDFFSNFPLLGGIQTAEELYAAQQTQTSYLKWLNEQGHSIYVDMRISPVSRAVSTAKLATFDGFSHINEMIFDSDMVEQQWPLKQICSGQASKKPSDLALELHAQGFCAAHFGNDALLEGETNDAFDMRVNRAKDTILAANPRVLSNLRINMTVAHGDLNKAIMAKIGSHPGLTHDIPASIDKLNYGEQYILVGVRDPETKQLKEVNYLGIYSRYGHRKFKEQVVPCFIEYFALPSEEARVNYMKQHKDKMIKNLPFLLFRKTDELSINALLNHLLDEHLVELKNRPDNSTGSNYIMSSSQPILTRAQSAPTMAIASITNTLSGKHPEPQQELLETLKSCDTAEKMRELMESALKKISTGKVTILIDAFIRKAKAYEVFANESVHLTVSPH